MKSLLVSIKSGSKIKVKVKNIYFGGDIPIIISGPCAVEDYDKMLSIAQKLKKLGVHMLRGGVFKPRTSPYDFQGLEYEGLDILKRVSEEVKLPVVSEIMDTRDVEKAIDLIDMIQIGSRNMYNYSLLKEVGKTKKPVLLKRGMSATLSEWMYAAEYIMSLGNENVVLCERGIRTFENFTRNTLDLSAVAAIKQYYRLPVIVDPSHGTGRRELVSPMSLASIAAGADGLILESHISPDESISDAKQTISVNEVGDIIERIRRFSNAKI